MHMGIELPQPYLYPDSGGDSSGISLDIVNLLPKASAIAHESMLPIETAEQGIQVLSLVVNAETSNIKLAQTSTLDEYKDLLASDDRSLSRALKIVSIESAAFIAKNPQLILFLPEFPSCFRLLRSAELCGGIRRGGDSLLIGSGATLHEVFAMYIHPPSDEDVQNMLAGEVNESSMLSRVMNIRAGNLPAHIDMLPGQVTAIEPDPEQEMRFLIASKAFPTQPEFIGLIPLTLSEAFENEEIPTDLDNILWYRADPQILGFDFGQIIGGETDSDTLEGVMNGLFLFFQQLKKEGSLAITVGVGNSREDRINRMAFMEVIHLIVKMFPLEVTTALPRNYSDNIFTKAMFQEPFGSLAGIFATKKEDI